MTLMALDLPERAVAALDRRIEGWVAGLQMAALSIKGRDAAAFVRAFGGSHRFILDYLVEEVLDRQSDDVQSFLLKTAILDRMTGSLCDAVRVLGEVFLLDTGNVPEHVAELAALEVEA